MYIIHVYCTKYTPHYVSFAKYCEIFLATVWTFSAEIICGKKHINETNLLSLWTWSYWERPYGSHGKTTIIKIDSTQKWAEYLIWWGRWSTSNGNERHSHNMCTKNKCWKAVQIFSYRISTSILSITFYLIFMRFYQTNLAKNPF